MARARRVREPMTPQGLEGVCAAMINNSVGFLGDSLSQERAELWKRYFGEKYGDEVPELSSYVATDAADVVDWLRPELLKIFLSHGRVVEFKPTGEDDEEAARQESDVINHIFFQRNDSYMILQSWMMDGLVARVGIVKCSWEERETVRREEYTGLTEEEAEDLVGGLRDEGATVDILSEADVTEIARTDDGIEVAYETTKDLEIRITQTTKQIRIDPIPPDEFLIAKNWTSLSLEGCPFTAHRRVDTTESDLIEDGYDPDQVKSLSGYSELNSNEERQVRHQREAPISVSDQNAAPGMRYVTVTECYIRTDWDGDGKAELLKVMVGGGDGAILKWAPDMKGEVDSLHWPYAIDEMEEPAFHAWSPYIIPHKFTGQSVVDKVLDLQRINSVITRQMLDNMVLTNNPRPTINMRAATEDTITDALDASAGMPIRVNGMPGETVGWLQVDPQIQWSLATLQHFGERRAERTGVTAVGQGMNPDTLNTASGFKVELLQEASQGRKEMFARNFGEALRGLFVHMHALMRRNADKTKKLAIKLRGKWIEVNPRGWKYRTEMEPLVGLGTGSKEKTIMGLQTLLQLQMDGLARGTVTYREIYYTLSRLVEALQVGEVESFFLDPETVEQMGGEAKPEDDAEAGSNEAIVQAEMTRAQGTVAAAQIRAQADVHKSSAQDDLKRDEMLMRIAADLMAKNPQLMPAAAAQAVLNMQTVLKALPNQEIVPNGAQPEPVVQ